MNKLYILFCLSIILLLTACSNRVSFPDAKNEVVEDIEGYNLIVRQGAQTEFKNYRFVDLRPRIDFLTSYVSNFSSRYNIEFKETDDIKKVLEVIEENNKAGFSMPIILLDSGEEGDDISCVVFELLVDMGYLNVRNIKVGFKELKNGHQMGFPYSIRTGSDCGC